MRSTFGFSGRLCCALLVLSPAVAWADAPPEHTEAVELLNQGVALYDDGNFAAAREAFLRAASLAPERPNPYRWLGLAEAKLGRCEEAIQHFEVFLTLVSSEDARFLEAVVERDRCNLLLGATPGSLKVDSSPAGAEVRLDGFGDSPVGTTPSHVPRVLPGTRRVFVDLAGFLPRAEAVKVGPGAATHVSLDLVASSPAVEGRRPLYKRWWLWTIVGVAVAGGAAALIAVVATSPSGSTWKPVEYP